MRHPFLSLVACAWCAACASPRRAEKLPRLELARVCDDGESRQELAQLPDPDASLLEERTTITDLDAFRKTVVLVNDTYFDQHRVDPKRILSAIAAALADRSRGALRFEGGAVVAGAHARWQMWDVNSIWQVPLALYDLGTFLIGHLPAGHRLVRGEYAELVATNAMLSTLDRLSTLLPLDPRARPGGAGARPPPIDPVLAPHVSSAKLPEGILQVRPGPIGPRTPALMRERLGTAGANGLILDLRGNPGGSVDAASQIADAFLSTGTILTMNGRDAAGRVTAHDDKLGSEHVKLAVLVDSRTGGGAEIIAGALRFNERAILIGEATAGYSLIPTLFEYRSRGTSEGPKAALLLSTAEAILPGDRSFDGAGIEPDLEIGSDFGAPRPCAPIGEKIAVIPADPAEPDAALAFAARVLATAANPSRAELLAAARALAAASH